MSRNRTRLLAALALVLANVAWPTAASAAPVTPEVFTSELAAAVSASGVLAPNTTLTIEDIDGSGASRPDRTRVTIVNPDGSLIERSTEADEAFEVRCTRFNRCWQWHDDAFPSRRWRLLPASEPAHYNLSSAEDIVPQRTEWPAGATFDIADVPGVGRVFTYTETHQSTDGTTSGSDTDTWTVTTSSVTKVTSYSLSSSEGGSWAGEFRTTLTSSTTPTRVVAPTARALPELHVAYVSVSINGCGALPAAADCG